MYDQQCSGDCHTPLVRVSCNFDTEESVFSWRTDGKTFSPLGDPFVMAFQLTTFQGVRLALFHYSTGGKAGGYADFDNFTVDEPRAGVWDAKFPWEDHHAHHGADGTVLTADTEKMSLVNVPTEPFGTAPTTLSPVRDLGKGRVALKAANGRFISAAEDVVSLKDLAGKPPGDKESFQWINLMRGDTMLMSLVNHRYLATQPNEPGPVTVSAVGPRPDRKGGDCSSGRKSIETLPHQAPQEYPTSELFAQPRIRR